MASDIAPLEQVALPKVDALALNIEQSAEGCSAPHLSASRAMPIVETNHTTMNNPPQTTVTTPAMVRLAGALVADWDLASTSAVNVLLIGESETSAAFVEAIRRHLVDPLITVDCRDGLDLSSVPSGGTVVLSDVAELTLADQQRLNSWLAAADHRPRVISTSRASLFPLVEAGMFVDSLYYRLNVVCLRANAGGINP